MALLAGGKAFGGRMFTVNASARRLSYARKPSNATTINDGPCRCFSPNQKLSKAAKLKERIRQFSIWFYETEDDREATHIKRRHDRQKHRDEINKLTLMKLLRLVLVLDILLWIVGGVFTICSTIEGIGRHTAIYKQREIYRIVGPFILGLASVILCVIVGCKNKILMANKLRKKKGSFYIVDKKKKKKKHNCKRKTKEAIVEESVLCELVDLPAVDTAEKMEISHEQLWRHLEVTENLSEQFTEVLQENRSDTYHEECTAGNGLHGSNTNTDSTEALVNTENDCYNGNQRDTRRNELLKQLSLTSTDSCDTDGAEGFTFSRDFSVRSKTSEISNFSNFSETAPLVKK